MPASAFVPQLGHRASDSMLCFGRAPLCMGVGAGQTLSAQEAIKADGFCASSPVSTSRSEDIPALAIWE